MGYQGTWTAERTEQLVLAIENKKTVQDISAEMGLSYDSIRGKISTLRCQRPYLAKLLDETPRKEVPPDFKAANAWTEEREQQLKDLLAKRCSSGVIALQMGITRNAVVGKIHRMGLRGAPRNPKPRKKRLRAKAVAVKTKAAAPVLTPEPLPIPAVDDKARISFLQLKEGVCHWPVGDVQSEEFGFCGLECKGRYCPGHVKRAYKPPQDRKKRRAHADA